MFKSKISGGINRKGCSVLGKSMKKGVVEDRMMVIGLDGATFKVLEPLMEKGLMPHLKALKEKGSWGILQSTVPPFTIPALASFVTGQNPGKHGLVSWVGPQNEKGRKTFVNASFIKGKTLWEILSESGKKIAVVNVPLTYPPRKVKGLMISGLLTPSLDSPFTYPPHLKEMLPDYRIDLNYLVGQENIISGPNNLPERRQLLTDIRDMTQTRGRTCLSLLNQERFDFFMVFFTGTDRLQHYFWDVLENICNHDHPKKSSLLMDEVGDYFKNLDEIIGEIREVFGSHTTTLVISDHGFGPSPRKAFHSLALFKRRKVILSLLKTIKHRRKEIVCRTNPWISFVPLYCNYGGIAIDGNKKRGEYQRIREELLSGLRSAVDSTTQERVVESVWKREEIYSGEYLRLMPDLIFCLNSEYVCGYGHQQEISERDPGKELGDHTRGGIFIVKGPGIKENSRIPPCSILDISPTILYGLNAMIPSGMDGRILTEIFSEDYRLRNTVKYQPADTPKKSGVMAPVYTSADERIIEGRLKDLGYL